MKKKNKWWKIEEGKWMKEWEINNENLKQINENIRWRKWWNERNAEEKEYEN